MFIHGQAVDRVVRLLALVDRYEAALKQAQTYLVDHASQTPRAVRVAAAIDAVLGEG